MVRDTTDTAISMEKSVKGSLKLEVWPLGGSNPGLSMINVNIVVKEHVCKKDKAKRSKITLDNKVSQVSCQLQKQTDPFIQRETDS